MVNCTDWSLGEAIQLDCSVLGPGSLLALALAPGTGQKRPVA